MTLISSSVAFGFAAVALTVVLTPGPNMAYLVSRSLCQGRRAGLVSLAGVIAAFSLYIVLTCAGLTALLVTIPVAYAALRLSGAAYLAYLAYTTLRPGGRTPFEITELSRDSERRLFAMGFLTNLLIPKAALLYLSLLPQFLDAGRGPLWAQICQLALLQIAISAVVNGAIIASSGAISERVRRNPRFARRQRVAMGTVLAGLACRMALDVRK